MKKGEKKTFVIKGGFEPKFNPNCNFYKGGFRTKVKVRAHIPLRKGGISPIAAFAFAPVLGYFGDKVLSLVFQR